MIARLVAAGLLPHPAARSGRLRPGPWVHQEVRRPAPGTRAPRPRLGVVLAVVLHGVLLLALGTVCAQEWAGGLALSQPGEGLQYLYFGVRPQATNGLDPEWEMELPPPPPRGDLFVRFTGPGLGNGVQLDLRATSADSAHQLNLAIQWGTNAAGVAALPLEIRWSPVALAAGTSECRLRDAFGGVLGIDVDMRVDSTLVLSDDRITILVLAYRSTGSSVPPRQLRFTTQPEGTVNGQPLSAQPVVAVLDADGRVDEGFNGCVWLSPAAHSRACAQRGVVAFTDVEPRSTQGGAVVLHAADEAGGLLARPAAADTLWLDAVATRLTFVQLPDGLASGRLFPEPIVAAVDAAGAIDVDFHDTVQLELRAPDDITRFESPAWRGLAAFPGVPYTPPPGPGVPGVELVATSGGLRLGRRRVTLTTTTAADQPLADRRLAFVAQPATVRSGETLADPLVVALVDTLGNLVTDSPGTVLLQVLPGSSAAVRDARLWGAASAPLVAGVARFDSLAIAAFEDGQAVQLAALYRGTHSPEELLVQADTSAIIGVDVVARYLSFQAVPDAVGSGQLSPAPVVAASGTFGAVDRDFTGTVELAIETPAGPVGSPTIVHAVAGLAHFDPRIDSDAPAAEPRLIRLAARVPGLPEAATEWLTLAAVADGHEPADLAPPDLSRLETGRWYALGPPTGGHITSLACDVDGRTIYAGTLTAGLWRSAHRVAWWWPARGLPADVRVDEVAALPRAGWALAATEAGLYRSTDAGLTWTRVSAVAVTDLEVGDGESPDIFAAGSSLLRSQDLGGTWHAFPHSCTRLALDQSNGLLCTDSAVFHVAPQELTLAHSTALPGIVRCLAVDPSAQRLYAGASGALYISADSGRTWTAHTTSSQHYQDYGPLALLVTRDGVYAGDGIRLAMSTDRGEVWHTVAEFPNPVAGSNSIREMERTHAVTSLTVDGGGLLLAGTAAGGVYRETGSGSWQQSAAGMGNTGVGAITLDWSRRGSLYVTVDGKVYKTTDWGATWEVVLAAQSLDYVVAGVAIHPRNPDVLLTEGPMPLSVSTSGGGSWRALGQDNSFLWPRSIAFWPADPNLIVAGTHWPGASVAVSQDGGHVWEYVPVAAAGTEFHAHVVHASPDAQAIFVGTSQGLYRAKHPDADWAAVLGGPPAGQDVLTVTTHPARPAEVMAGTAAGQVWRSTDQGRTWQLLGLPAGNGTAVSSVVIDSVTDAIYLGTRGAGLLASRDNGGSWELLGHGLPSQRILTLRVDPLGRRLYAGTGAGLFAMELPVAASTSPVTAVLAAPGAEGSRLGVRGVWPNPFNASTQIRFTLPAAGPVSLSVYDVLGRHVVDLVDEALPAGEHSALWDSADARGTPAGSGVYLLRLSTPGGTCTSRAVLVR